MQAAGFTFSTRPPFGAQPQGAAAVPAQFFMPLMLVAMQATHANFAPGPQRQP